MTKKGVKENGKAPSTVKCAVCMEVNAYANINCVHKFCMKCITKWTKVKFPILQEKSKLSLVQSWNKWNKVWNSSQEDWEEREEEDRWRTGAKSFEISDSVEAGIFDRNSLHGTLHGKSVCCAAASQLIYLTSICW